MVMLAEMLPTSEKVTAYFDWTYLAPMEKIKKIPESKEDLCPEAIGIGYDLQVAKGYGKQEWKMIGGKKFAMGMSFRGKNGTSPTLVFNSTNTMAALSVLGKDASNWAGQWIHVYIQKLDRHPKTGKPCCGVRLREPKQNHEPKAAEKDGK